MSGVRLAVQRLSQSEGGADRYEAELRAGRAPHEALRSAGASPEVIELLREAAPADAGAVLQPLADAFERFARARAELRRLSLYPLLLAGMGTTLGVLAALVLPRLLRWASFAPVPVGGAFLALVLDVALLVALSLLLRSGRAAFPMAEAIEGQERALVLSGAASLAKAGAPLPKSLRAAAHLGPGAGAEARALADALDRGETSAGEKLFGPLGAALFSAAAARGAGEASLQALAALEASAAERELPRTLLRAHVLALLLGGAAVALGGAALMQVYTDALGGG